MKQVEIHTRLLEALLECPVAGDWQLIEGVPEATADDGRWARNHLYDFVGIYEDRDGDLPHEPIKAHLPVWALVQNPTFDDDEVKQWIRLHYGVELRSSYLTEHAEMTRIRARRVDARLPNREARDGLRVALATHIRRLHYRYQGRGSLACEVFPDLPGSAIAISI